MKSKRDQAYDIRRLYEEMELELIESLRRNLSRHKIEELKEGFKFEQWQSAKLRELERFRKDNIKILGKYIPATELTIAKTLTDTYRNSQNEINGIILELKNDLIQGIDIRMPGDLEVILTPLEKELSEEMTREALEKIKAFNELPTPIDDSFFRLNDDKFNALVETVENDFKQGNRAVLRRMDDVYRQTIFKAQVHYNTGTVDLGKAIDMATKDFLDKGVDAITYKNGNKVNIASYAEMALRTANHRAYLMGEGKAREKLGISFVVVSAHATSCELCVPWQGLIVIDDVYGGGKAEDGPYPLLSEAMKQNFLHPQCRHNLSTFFHGINTLPTIPDSKKALDNYEQEQKQRYLERIIRRQKRVVAGTTDEANLKIEKDKLVKLQKDMREHLEENPQLRRAYGREKLHDVSNKDLKAHENTLKQKAIDVKIEETRKYIKSDACNKKIHEGRQGKHLKGHSNYEGKSYLLEGVNPQELVDKYASTGELRFTKKKLKWIKKEFVEAKENIGVDVDIDTGKKTITNYFSVSYADKGTHVVPRKRKKEESND